MDPLAAFYRRIRSCEGAGDFSSSRVLIVATDWQAEEPAYEYLQGGCQGGCPSARARRRSLPPGCEPGMTKFVQCD
jgi:hypothetical protein